MEYISTTVLANSINLSSKELFTIMKEQGLTELKNSRWILTEKGRKQGGKMRQSENGDYIIWPENFNPLKSSQMESDLLNATIIGKHFNTSSQRLNLILAELGWIKKDVAGWLITKLGKSLNGQEYEHNVSGNSFVLWPKEIIQNKSLIGAFTQSEKTEAKPILESHENSSSNFRSKFPANIRTKDGHFVRSRAELLIDNSLYEFQLVHAYERKLPLIEEVYTDFFLPKESVYIEYWGLENDSKYLERKKQKLEIYRKYDLKLIELTDSDIENLDDHLPKKLLKFGIRVF